MQAPARGADREEALRSEPRRHRARVRPHESSRQQDKQYSAQSAALAVLLSIYRYERAGVMLLEL